MVLEQRWPAAALTAVAAAALVVLLTAGSAAGRHARALAPTQVTLTAVADTYVEADTPTTNYGTSNRLRIDTSPDTRGYVRFDLSGITAPIVSASLQLMPTASLAAGFEVHAVADDSWVESGPGGIDYMSAPPFDSSVAATSGAVTANTTVSLDVTQLALAADGGLLSVALVARSATQLPFTSRETATPPQLVVTVDPNLKPPANTSLPTIADLQGQNPPTSTDTLQAAPGTWSPAADAFHYQWQTCTPSLSSCTNVGTDSATLPLATADIGSVVRVVVTASNQVGTGAPATSAATAAVVAPPPRETITLTPVADSYVAGDAPSSNFGGASVVRVDSSPDTRSYLTFDLSSFSGPIVEAQLQAVPTASLLAGFEAHGVADTSWTEQGITYANAPAFTAAAAGTSGPVTAGTTATVDVTSAMPADGGGLVSLALLPRSPTQLNLKSRETASPPHLVVTIDQTVAGPTNTAAPTISDQLGNNPPQTADSLAAAPGSWTNAPTAFDYAWQACTSDLASCRPIGADAQVVTLSPAEAGSVIRVRVTASNQAGSGTATSIATAPVVSPVLGHDPVVMAAGDIACGAQSTGAACAQNATANLMLTASPDLVLPLGDNQYECGALSDFQSKYDASWGELKSITRPVTGNHEYTTSTSSSDQCFNAPTGAPGYYTYFGSRGSPLDFGCTVFCKGYYSYDVGGWHLIALNSNCTRIGGCTINDPQVQWLQADLNAHATQCILAYWHHPRWTSGQELPSAFMDTIYRILYAAHADVILNGHDHDYERFAPLDPNGNVDPVGGIREFVVGTGGRNLTTFVTVQPGSEVRDANSFGVLRLVLHQTGYEWQFVPVPGATLSDSGSQPCHSAAANDTVAPSVPGRLTASAVLSTRVDLAWQTATDNVGVVAYRIYRNGTLLTTVGNLKGFSDNGAQPSTSYTYTVSAVDASGNESPRSAPAAVTTAAAEATPPIFTDGFETDTLDHWTNVAGAVTLDSSAPAAGAYAARVVPGGQVAFAYNQFAPTVNELWLRARFRVNSLTTTANLFRLRTSAATAGASVAVLTVYLTNTGKLAYRNEPAATNVLSTTSVSTGVWHTLLLHVRLGDATSGLVETTLDGVSVAPLTGPAALQTPPIGRVQIGDATSGHTFDASYDDVVASSVTLPAARR